MNPVLQVVLTGLVVGSLAMGVGGFSIWYERKFAARLQNRPGPTEVGPFGLGQLVADGLKLIQKEIIIPRAASKWLFLMAPPLAGIGILLLFGAIPWSETVVPIPNLHIGVLWVFAFGSIVLFPHWIAGWASNNKYALLGGMRTAAQAISYEIPLLLCGMVPIILAGSFSLNDIVAAQSGYRWYVSWPPGPGLIAFGLFFMCSLAEANRIPFDIPEAESELIGGVNTEYTGLFGVIITLGEYLHTLVASALCALLFLGGWEGPFADGMHWMLIKTFVLYFSIFWVRWSWMRYRSDQLMKICWHYLVPASLGLVAAAALWVRLVEAA